jgi:hypothetical protein
MDASLWLRAEQLASDFSNQASTAEDLNAFIRLRVPPRRPVAHPAI